MIEKITVVDGANDFPCSWWKKAFKQRKKFEFKAGLNIIVGPNGSGKSTLTQTIAKMFYCEQGGRTSLTQHAFLEMYPIKFGEGESKSKACSFDVEHDGSAVYYFNPNDVVGMSGGSFDDDFFNDGLFRLSDKGSTGQHAVGDFNRILALIQEDIDKGEFIDNPLDGRCNPTYQRYIDEAVEFLGGKGKRPTVILDEPSRSLDLLNQLEFWNLIDGMVKAGFQIIVATHSMAAIKHEAAHFIETKRGYRKKCLKRMDEVTARVLSHGEET